jgi:hypothetical protein
MNNGHLLNGAGKGGEFMNVLRQKIKIVHHFNDLTPVNNGYECADKRQKTLS